MGGQQPDLAAAKQMSERLRILLPVVDVPTLKQMAENLETGLRDLDSAVADCQKKILSIAGDLPTVYTYKVGRLQRRVRILQQMIDSCYSDLNMILAELNKRGE